MTETTTATRALTKADIRALRTADRIAFYDRTDNQAYDGTVVGPHIRAIKETPETERSRDPFAPRERSHLVEVEYSTVHAYDGSHGPYVTFSWVPFAQLSQEWQTIARSLREGESLTFRWVRGNSSPVLTDAHLIRDELHLAVGREGKPARHYLIAVEVGLDNSARMIRTL